MTSIGCEQLRNKDRTVLLHIKEGADDIQKITSATTLENHEVNYCFQKLEYLGLIEVEKPDGMVERMIDGQKRVFEAPKQADVTGTGEKYLRARDEDTLDRYDDLSHEELVEMVHDHERRIAELVDAIQVLKEQFQRTLD